MPNTSFPNVFTKRNSEFNSALPNSFRLSTKRSHCLGHVTLEVPIIIRFGGKSLPTGLTLMGPLACVCAEVQLVIVTRGKGPVAESARMRP